MDTAIIEEAFVILDRITSYYDPTSEVSGIARPHRLYFEMRDVLTYQQARNIWVMWFEDLSTRKNHPRIRIKDRVLCCLEQGMKKFLKIRK